MEKNKIFVGIGCISDGLCIESVYPKERNDEIEICKNPRVKLEKFSAWEMLRYLVERNLEIPFESVNFSKSENGKWMSDKFLFSISHSDGVVAVAVGNVNVGIDIESVRRHSNGIERQIFTEKELLVFGELTEEKRKEHIIRVWTEKESIFKTLEEKCFAPKQIETSEYTVQTQNIRLNGKDYVLSVCTACDGETEIQYDKFK